MPEPQLTRVVSEVGTRLRMQRALETFVSGGVLWALGATVLVYLVKLELLAPNRFWLLLAASGAAVTVAAALQALRAQNALSVAKLIDRSHGLHDRIGTAFEFSSGSDSDDWKRAQIAEALRHLDSIQPRRAAPYRWPRDAKLLGLLTLCLMFVVVLRFPARPVRAVITSKPLERLTLDADSLGAQRAIRNELALDAQENPELRRLSNELNELLAKLERKELTRKELFAKLAELEKKHFEGMEGNFDELLERFKKMGGSLQKEKLTKDLGASLKRADLEQAKREMEKLAQQVEKLHKRDRQKVARSLQRAAKTKLLDIKKLQQQARALERQIRRLQRKTKSQPQDRQARRRLRRKRRQLQQLNRQQQRLAAQRRQLEQLNRDMQQAAANLLNKLTAAERKQLQQLAKQLGRFADQINKLQSKKRAQMSLRDLKEMLRRMGKGGKMRVARLKDFLRRAGGNKQGQKSGQGQGQGQGRKQTFVIGPNGKMVPVPGQGSGQGKSGSGDQPGDGIGNSSDPNLKSDATRIRSRRKDIFVRGKDGNGPTRSEVILGASDKGFATRHYRRVYRDYRQVIEDVMQREDVPLGYKYYVKRYFRYIKPR